MKRKALCDQKLDLSMCRELSDREAESLQGGAISPSQQKIILLAPSPNNILLFSNPFSA